MTLIQGIRMSIMTPSSFSETFFPEYRLRQYQARAADAIGETIHARFGIHRSSPGYASLNDFAAVFSRQAGKDEMLAQLSAWLLVRYQHFGGQVVIALPALDPQGYIQRNRLLNRLETTRIRALGVRAVVRDGRMVQVGRASVHFVSASPMANARGLTASLLLVANEAQDIEPDRWDAVFAPMAASTNAVTLFMGTVWTSETLLSRQLRFLHDQEREDGRQRRYLADWRQVALELPSYGHYVERQMALLGRDHPFIRTEYELIELDGEAGLFPASRRGQMQGSHPPLERCVPGETYAMLIDVAGEEEHRVDQVRSFDPHGKRDSTALTVVRVRQVESERPRYEVVRRYLWTGVRHTELHAQLVDLARNVWRTRHVVIDSTGLGAGLASFLRGALGERVVLPFVFSQSSKSKLGWDFLGLIDSGRYKDYTVSPTTDQESAELARLFWRQVGACRYQVRPGPNRILAWEVPDQRTHDDLLVSAALVGVLDELDWRPRQARGRPEQVSTRFG